MIAVWSFVDESDGKVMLQSTTLYAKFFRHLDIISFCRHGLHALSSCVCYITARILECIYMYYSADLDGMLSRGISFLLSI